MSKTVVKVSDTIDIEALEVELEKQSTEDLKVHFFNCYNGAERFIVESAICAKILKARGENTTGFPMVGTYLRIAEGQILAKLVWMFIESPNRNAVERLPKSAQEEIAENPMVPVVEAKPGGGWTKRMYDLRTAPAAIIKVAIGDEGIRTTEEQQIYLTTQKPRPIVKPSDDDVTQEPLTRSLAVKLTESEFASLKMHAAVAGVTESKRAHRFLDTAGAFKRPKT